MQKVLLAASALTTALMTSGCVIVVADDDDSKMLRSHDTRTSDGYVVLDRDGDYSRLAGDVNLRGRIGGDLSLVAGDVDIDNMEIGGEASIAAGDVDFSGRVRGEVSIAGGDIDFSAEVHDELSLAGGEIDFSGRAHGEAALAAGEMRLAGWFGDALHAQADAIWFTGEAIGPVKLVAAEEIRNSRRNNQRGLVEVGGTLSGGAEICAISVIFTETSHVAPGVTVWAEQPPVTQTGARISGLDYQPRNGRDCDDLIDD